MRGGIVLSVFLATVALLSFKLFKGPQIINGPPNRNWYIYNAQQNSTFVPSSVIARTPSLAVQCFVNILCQKSNRGLNLSNTNKRRLGSKQNTTLVLLIILLGGDIQTNPGPTKYPCGMCERPVAKNHRGLECDECRSWVHIKCGDVAPKQYESLLHKTHFTWICPKCSLPNFSESFFDNSDLADKNIYDSISEHNSSTDSLTTFGPPRESSSPKNQEKAVPRNAATKNTAPRSKKSNKDKEKPNTRSKVKKGKLKFMTINCQGLKGKQRQKFLATIIDTEKPDIIMGQESKLDQNYKDSEVFPTGYLVKRKDRNAHGGGVFIAYRDNMIVTEVKGVGNNCEFVMLKVQVWKSKPIYVGSFYRQPNRDPATLLSLHSDLEKVFGRGIPKLILAGDFNLPSINWQDYSINDNPQYGRQVNETMLDFIDKFYLEQHVLKPTRLDNILDLIFTTMPDSIHNIQIIPGMSDHEAVGAECDTDIHRNKRKQRTVHMYKQANVEGIAEDLKEFAEGFTATGNDRSCSENWTLFKEALDKSMTSHVPTKTLSGRWNLPWMNKNIKRLMKKRQRKYNSWKKYNDGADLAEYKKLKDEVTAALKQAHDKYIDGLFEAEDTENPAKKLWGYVKSLKIDKIGIPPLKWKNKLVSLAKQKAEALSHQYKSVFTREDTDTLPSKGPSTHAKMDNINITTNGVEKLLSALNPKKAIGPDQVSTWMLKSFAPILAPILQTIFTQSLRTGEVPLDWKRANISAIFKKGDRSDPANYRPVSLTSVSCKMLEHILASNIRKHLDQHNILSQFQHGFRKKHSCETQLLSTIEDLARSLDKREQIDCLILDFSKAFDSVPHQRLLHKLGWYGINGEAHKWIGNWLTGRKQTVMVDGETSEEANVSSGVPQGTVLGPLLFILYINDIGDGTTSTLRLFADDALIYRKISSESDATALQADLDKLIEWSTKWQMRFNPSKCSLLRVARNRNTTKANYQMMGTTLEQNEHHPYLGVEIASGLEWKQHVNNISNKARRTLNFLQRNLHRCPQKVRKQAYTSLVRPTLEYASTVWDPHHQREITQLEQVQRKAIRFMAKNYRRRASVTEMRTNLGFQTLQARRQTQRLTMLYRVHNQLVCVEMPPCYTPRHTTSQMETRSNHGEQYTKISTRTDCYKYSFFPRTISAWNQLPSATIQAPSAQSFNNRVSKMDFSKISGLYIGPRAPPADIN